MENKQEVLPHTLTFLKMDKNPITHKDNTIILLDGHQLNYVMEASFGFDADRSASVITLKLLGNVVQATLPEQAVPGFSDGVPNEAPSQDEVNNHEEALDLLTKGETDGPKES